MKVQRPEDTRGAHTRGTGAAKNVGICSHNDPYDVRAVPLEWHVHIFYFLFGLFQFVIAGSCYFSNKGHCTI